MRIVIHYLEEIDGVAIFPIIGMLIFITFFLFLIYYIYNLDKGFVEEMSDSPLDFDVEKDETLNNNLNLQNEK